MDPALLREREAFKKRAMATPTYVYQYFDYYKYTIFAYRLKRGEKD